MDRKFLPLILMLSAGLVTVIITFIRQYTIVAKLGILLGVLVCFYCVGTIIVWILNSFDRENEAAKAAETADTEQVIEKEGEESVAR